MMKQQNNMRSYAASLKKGRPSLAESSFAASASLADGLQIILNFFYVVPSYLFNNPLLFVGRQYVIVKPF
jgi:hypothetical protein